MEALKEAFAETLEDALMSRAERRELRALVLASDLTEHQQNWLFSEVFKMANERIGPDNGGAVLSWLENANKAIRSANTAPHATPAAAFFSPGEDCMNTIVNAIKTARQTLHICVFTISDNRISAAIKAAHDRGIAIKILTDNDKSADKGSDIWELTRYGIPTRMDLTPNHMHHKFAVIDKRQLLTGSYNWTRSAERYNQENILVTEDVGAVKSYLREFDRLWGAFG